VLIFGKNPHPSAAGAHRLRFSTDAVEARIAEVRAWFASRGRAGFVWWVGGSATPSDLEARLRAAGATTFEHDPVITSMVLTEPPPAVAGVEIRRVETFEDFVAAQELAWASMQMSEEELAAVRAVQRERWAEHRSSSDSALYLALEDGEPVARGGIMFLPFAGFLAGAATREDARGRGLFRALVRARWDEAARRGTPALVVGAGAMSRPILARLGFRTVAEARLLLDRSA